MRKEHWKVDGGKIIRHKQEDVEPALNRAAELRSNGITSLGKENWHVGSIPKIVLENWVKEAGLRFDDREAVADLIKRKLLSGEFDKLRVHGGTF